MRLSFALASLLFVAIAPACSKQSVGQRCSLAFPASGDNSDCASPLRCTAVIGDTVCCPETVSSDTPSQCRLPVVAIDAGVQDAAPTVSDAALLDAAKLQDAAADVQGRDSAPDGGESPDADAAL
jgi:hypothetical protein